MRPLHVNGVIFGAFSAIFLWNVTLLVSFIFLLLGYNKGLEVAEFPNPLSLLLAAALFIIAYQVFMTIARRKEEKIYVSLWYIIAAPGLFL